MYPFVRTVALILFMVSVPLFALFDNQKVPIEFEFLYWDKSSSFESYHAISDRYICDEVSECSCSEESPGVLSIDCNRTVIDAIKQDLYNNHLDIAEVSAAVIDDTGDGDEGFTIISDTVRTTTDGRFIIEENGQIRPLTDEEIEAFQDAVAEAQDYNRSDIPEETLQLTHEILNNPDTNASVYDNIMDEEEIVATSEAMEENRSSVLEEFTDFADTLNPQYEALAESLADVLDVSVSTQGIISSAVNALDFSGIEWGALSDYFGDGSGTSALLGQLGITGSIECYADLEPLRNTAINFCRRVGGVFSLNDNTEHFDGSFTIAGGSSPSCPNGGEFFPALQECRACRDPNAIWDKRNHECKICQPGYQYDQEFDLCIDTERTLHSFNNVVEHNSSTFDKFFSFSYEWTKVDEKYDSKIYLIGMGIDERFFTCVNQLFTSWSYYAILPGAAPVGMHNNVSALGNTQCVDNPAAGWNDQLDTAVIDYHHPYYDYYEMEYGLDLGWNTVSFGFYRNPAQLQTLEQKYGVGGLERINQFAAYIETHIRRRPHVVSDVRRPVSWSPAHEMRVGCEGSSQESILPDPCSLIEPDVVIAGRGDDKAVKITTAQRVHTDFIDGSARLLTTHIQNGEDEVYPSGISYNTLNRASDLNMVLRGGNSAVSNSVLSNNSEVFALIKQYAKSDVAAQNHTLSAHPSVNAAADVLRSVRPDFVSLPNTNQEVYDDTAAMSEVFAQNYNLTNYLTNTMLYFSVEFGKAEGYDNIMGRNDLFNMEQEIFKNLVTSDISIDNKALIEKKAIERFVAIESMVRGFRIVSPTQEAVVKIPSASKMNFIVRSNKQMLKDAYTASLFSRIHRFQNDTADIVLHSSRVNARKAYSKAMVETLNDATNWSKDIIK